MAINVESYLSNIKFFNDYSFFSMIDFSNVNEK